MQATSRSLRPVPTRVPSGVEGARPTLTAPNPILASGMSASERRESLDVAGKGPMAGDGAGGAIDATSVRILYRR